MNFLAHIYLSDNNENIQLGNFFADSVKGKKYLNYPDEIQKGILLHRFIDSYTDDHPQVRISKRRLDPKYGLYKGIIIDIFYDHFLAINWTDFCRQSLHEFSELFYQNLERNFDILPENTKRMVPYLVEQSWLESYATFEGIENVLKGMNRRTQLRSQMDLAISDLQLSYEELETDFHIFFPELMESSKEKLKTL
ncbi:acyl carrier protein phosphodiesterase [Namhaeicola litoreus]|uniref:ACP phosphodiesterase n=1 Tax=Namhaeicola litoreus TaxID=1052145 RepID=A0ABW3Y398_9FLAO